MKKFIFSELITVILLIAFTLSIFIPNNLSYPAYSEDGTRDYLVADHIITNHEGPLVGPANSILNWSNSSIYYFILALLLSIRNEVMFLGIIHIIFQIFTMLFVYLLARNLFNRISGVIASVLFVCLFSLISNQFTDYVMQPWVMQPFVVLSYLLVYLSYVKRRYKLLLFASVILAFASAIGNYSLSLIPIFLLFSFIILKAHKSRYLPFILIILTLMGSLFIFYLPHLYHFANHGIGDQFIPEGKIIKELPEYANQLLKNLINLGIFLMDSLPKIYNLILKPIPSYFLVLIIIVETFVISMQGIAITDTKLTRESLIILLLTVLLQPFIFASFSQHSWFWYFTPSFSLISIIIAGIFSYPLPKIVYQLRKIHIRPVFIFLWVFLVIPGLIGSTKSLINSFKNNYTEFTIPAVKFLENKILEIKTQENKNNLNFFQIRSYNEAGQRWAETIFLVPIEKHLNHKFTRIVNYPPSFEQTNNTEFMFLVCPYEKDEGRKIQTCKDKFSKKFPSHHSLERIYGVFPFVIYLSKR